MSEEEEDVLPAGARVWITGTLLKEPKHLSFSDGNEVTYLLVTCDIGGNRLVSVPCSARGTVSRYCQAKQYTRGDLLWIRGLVREKKENSGQITAVVNIEAMTGETSETWQESEA
ncbi:MULTISPECIES: hypothetical protein [Bifidobacterium]|uniref:Single-stranded DNA-binding protein n=2 Tax=Bifidobacterium TaxID=1678 RepID=A0A261GBM4_9BIFI|nr:hypothetical protein [Bifidobacterium aquikefiri]OZG68822.1 hypothetical protein BAQU_0123 [Bifidobacterium aquikefiri]